MLCLHVFAITMFSRHWEVFLYVICKKRLQSLCKLNSLGGLRSFEEIIKITSKQCHPFHWWYSLRLANNYKSKTNNLPAADLNNNKSTVAQFETGTKVILKWVDDEWDFFLHISDGTRTVTGRTTVWCLIFAQIAVDQACFVCFHCISYSVLFSSLKNKLFPFTATL